MSDDDIYYGAFLCERFRVALQDTGNIGIAFIGARAGEVAGVAVSREQARLLVDELGKAIDATPSPSGPAFKVIPGGRK